MLGGRISSSTYSVLWLLTDIDALPTVPRLVTMQSVIADTQRSLAKIVREIDKILVGDGTPALVSIWFIIDLTAYIHLTDYTVH